MEPVRLSKRMAEMKLCSRREADSYIEQGWVRVNGQVAVLGQKVTPEDKIELDKRLGQAQAQRVNHPDQQADGLCVGPGGKRLPARSRADYPGQPVVGRPFRRAFFARPHEGPGAGRPSRHRLCRPAGADTGWSCGERDHRRALRCGKRIPGAGGRPAVCRRPEAGSITACRWMATPCCRPRSGGRTKTSCASS